MPIIKKAKKTPDDVQAQIGKMLENPIFQSNKTNPQHNEFLQHIKEELREFQAYLATATPEQQEQLGKWVNLRSTTTRLSNIENAIHVLQTAETKQTKPSVINQCVRNVNHGTQYNTDFMKYLHLEDLIARQQALQNKYNKIQSAKDFVANTADIAGSLNTAVKAGRAVGTASSLTAESASTLAHTGQALGSTSSLLHAIPILGGLVNAATATGSAIYSFAKKKGASDNVAKVITAGVAIAGVACTILFPVAALGIAAGVSAATTVTNYVKPFIELGKEIKAKEAELEVSKARITEIDKPGTTLVDHEKEFLVQRLNDHYAKNGKMSLETLKETAAAIRQGKLDDLEKNPHVRASLGLSEQQSVKDKLVEYHTSNNNNLAATIESLKKERTTKGALAVSNTVTTAGLVMMAIPFPPVILAGAVVAAVSTVASVVIQYREQIANAIKKGVKAITDAFKGKKKDELTNEKENTLTNKNDIEMSVIKAKEPEKKAPEVIATVKAAEAKEPEVKAAVKAAEAKAPEITAEEVKAPDAARKEEAARRFAVTATQRDETSSSGFRRGRH